MPVWGWVLVVLFGVGLLAVVAFSVWVLRKAGGMRADILERGDDAQAWVVDVQPAVGLMGPTPLVLVSPERDIPDDEMRALVARLQALRTRQRKPADKAEREAVRLTRSEEENPGRERLPDGFTGGREVYSLFMSMLDEDEKCLPTGALQSEWFAVRVIWDEYPTMMSVPPRKKRRRRRG